MPSKARLGAATTAVAVVVSIFMLTGGPASAVNGTTSPTTDPNFGPLISLLNPAPPTTTPPPTAPPPPRPPTAGLPAGSGAGRRIVYCVNCHRVWLVEANEAVVRTHLVSGRLGVPRLGTYSVFSRSAATTSGRVTMQHMVRFAQGRGLAVGFHSIPRDRRGRPIQTEAQLGTFRSHGCVRQSDTDALVVWNFAPLGTKVVVV